MSDDLYRDRAVELIGQAVRLLEAEPSVSPPVRDLAVRRLKAAANCIAAIPRPERE